MQTHVDVTAIAQQSLDAIDRGAQVAPFASKLSEFSSDDAYAVVARMRQMREARGERVVGRKIGFTNRRIWSEYGVYAPIWGYVFDTSLRDIADLGSGFSLDGFVEPKIEPEIAFKLRRAPGNVTTPQELLQSIEWIAHTFEIVQSIFPEWKFTAADSIAANGVHGALLLGPQRVTPQSGEEWEQILSSFQIELYRDDELADRGEASNVIGGPLHALLHLVEVLKSDRHNPPLAAGEIITTGTLTRAFPAEADHRWNTVLHGVPLGGIAVGFV